ncbi:hypothetical protein SS50377_25389 [Spironucleus salmonicida]|uniref:Uncharacterized protein n=1 Tax=Spironucleus salmonicida TaxID=348837 RepID=V6LKP6_9EUKA|nr:hypothetical protein SS50377_25389 [Spironucleus salmonicida]|eukprot:EST44933.1 Hypothetical protein SS50377_14951 [Spironucleus salmonicida]
MSVIKTFASSEIAQQVAILQDPDLKSILDRAILFFVKSNFYNEFETEFVKSTEQFPYSKIYTEVQKPDSRYQVKLHNIVPQISPEDELGELQRKIYTLKLFEVDTSSHCKSHPKAVFLLDIDESIIYAMPSVFELQETLLSNSCVWYGKALDKFILEEIKIEQTEEW